MKHDIEMHTFSTQKKIAMVCLGIVILAIFCGLLEGASYVVFRTLGWPKYNYEVVENPFHPILSWVHAKNITMTATGECYAAPSRITTDDKGRSITPNVNAANPQLVIAVTGGSTVFGMGSTSNETTIPSQLEKLVKENMGIDVEVHNLATRGYQSFQEMASLHMFLAAQKADLVVAVTGRNDSHYAAFNEEIESAYTRKYIAGTTEFVRQAERGELVSLRGVRGRLRASSYAFDLMYRMLKRAVYTPFQSEEARPSTVKIADNLSQRTRMTNINYELMHQVAKGHGAEFVVMLQPTPSTKRTLTEHDQKCAEMNEERGRAETEYELKYYDRLRSLDKSYPFVDLSHVLDDISEDVYVDTAHYNDRGAKQIAESVFLNIKLLISDLMQQKASPEVL